MFTNERQKARLCRAVCTPVFRDRAGSLWTEQGPTERAWDLYDADGGALSTTERALLLTAFAIWRGTDDGPPVGLLLHRLGEPATRRLATVIALLCGDVSEIEPWLAHAEAADGFAQH